MLVDRLLAELAERGEGGGDDGRVTVVRAGEEGGGAGAGREEVHQVGAATDRADGGSVGDGLAQGGEVGSDAGDLLPAADVVAEARDDLVEDQDAAGPGGLLAERGEELLVREEGTDVVRDGLDDDGGDVGAVLGEGAADGLAVVERQDEGGFQDLGKDARRDRVVAADLLRGGDHVEADRVVPTVVAALELDDEAASCGGAGDAQGVERGLAAGTGEQDLLDRRDQLGELFGEEDLALGDADAHVAEGGSGLDGGAGHVGVVVAEQRRAERGVEVGVLASVGGTEPCAVGPGDDQVGQSGNAALTAVHAAGNDLAGALGESGSGIVAYRA